MRYLTKYTLPLVWTHAAISLNSVTMIIEPFRHSYLWLLPALSSMILVCCISVYLPILLDNSVYFELLQERARCENVI